MTKTHDVYVFGDSHWRVFFPFVNHGPPGAEHTEDDIRTIDMVANELSGTTMYGLLNPNSKHHGRQRILYDLDTLEGVENVALVFGEVDARYHASRYFDSNGYLSIGRIQETLSRFRRFIDEDLIRTNRVTRNVFVYHGFAYPKGPDTLLQPSQPMGEEGFRDSKLVNDMFHGMITSALTFASSHVTVIRPVVLGIENFVSEDGVHLIPEKIYPKVLDQMKRVLQPTKTWELSQ